MKPIPKFVQIASSTCGLFALDEDGGVWLLVLEEVRDKGALVEKPVGWKEYPSDRLGDEWGWDR